jgi:hypothetical protein
MAEWIQTIDGNWHRLVSKSSEEGPHTMKTACGMLIPDDETVPRSPNPPEQARHAPDREAPAHG